MRKIALVSTGGTISMKNDQSGHAMPALGAKEFIESLTEIGTGIQLDDVEFKKIPSAHMTQQDLIQLRDLVLSLEAQQYDGIVITHGTDTMEETAYFLDLTTSMQIPLILTGAQRNLSTLGSDVFLNISDSVRVAADPGAHEMGVLIVFASEIIPAREATKVHRTQVNTFRSLEFGPIGTVDNGRVLWHRKPMMRDVYLAREFQQITVDIIVSCLGGDSRQLKHAVNDQVKGIVVQGLGAGHLPEAMIEGIEEAVAADIPVVLTSRTYMGRFLTSTYGYRGSEKHLKELGVIFGEDITTQKARIKLMVLLSMGFNSQEIAREFEKHHYLTNATV